ncbi:MAG: abortive infection system toxin AbiGii family protein [Oscillospiraceae bacterium]|nr:abortive infection system toxin AbiGii family protein [Oscillospiraceae bacterium]
MFSDFDKAFKKVKTQYKGNMPKAVLEAASRGLPGKLRYKDIGDGVCVVDTNTLGGCRLALSEKDKKNFKGKSQKDLLQYIYNTQTTVEILPNENGCFVVDGEEVKASDITKSPLRNLSDGIITKRYLSPEPFPDPCPLIVEGGGHNLKLMIQQQPYDSIEVQKFGTVNDCPIQLTFIAEPNEIHFTINISISKAKTVREIVSAIIIFNALVSGNGFLEGQKLDYNNPDKSFPDKGLKFWGKILEIEEFFEVNFNPQIETDLAHERKLEELYHSLILKKPFKKYSNIDNVSGTGNFNIDDANKMLGQEIRFNFVEEETIEVFGTSLSFCGLVCIFDATVKEYRLPQNNEQGEFNIKLEPTKGKKIYTSTLHFLNQESLDDFRKNEKHIDILSAANEIEYSN